MSAKISKIRFSKKSAYVIIYVKKNFQMKDIRIL